MSEHVLANILLPVGFVGTISHNEQFVSTTGEAYHSILIRILLLNVAFVGTISHNEQFFFFFAI